MCNSSKLLFSSITRLLISNLCQSTKFQQPIDKLFCIKQSPTPSCHVSEYKGFNQNVIVSHFNMCCNLAYISPPSTAPSKLLCYSSKLPPQTSLKFIITIKSISKTLISSSEHKTYIKCHESLYLSPFLFKYISKTCQLKGRSINFNLHIIQNLPP